jgi:predicted negative regulator of RcsB-dependent stress response
LIPSLRWKLVEKKVSRKELLKESDEFLTTSGMVIKYFRENPRAITATVGVAVVCVLAALAFTSYQKFRISKSHELFEAAHKSYAISMADPSPSPEVLDKLFKSFDTIAGDYRSLVSGEMALLYTGHVLYRKGDYKESLERYNRMQSTNIVKEGLAPLIMYHIAMTKFALKEYDQALSMFDQLSQGINSPYRREAFASIARIYESIGKNMEAVQAYKQYLKMFPEAPDAIFIKARISELSVKS